MKKNIITFSWQAFSTCVYPRRKEERQDGQGRADKGKQRGKCSKATVQCDLHFAQCCGGLAHKKKNQRLFTSDVVILPQSLQYNDPCPPCIWLTENNASACFSRVFVCSLVLSTQNTYHVFSSWTDWTVLNQPSIYYLYMVSNSNTVLFRQLLHPLTRITSYTLSTPNKRWKRNQQS